MPYIFLKNILESVIANYVCPHCKAKTSAEQVSITGMSSRGLDIHIVCSLCNMHSQLSAEVNTLASGLLTSENGQEFFNELTKNSGILDISIVNKKNSNTKGINAADIAKVDEDIQNAKSIEDLMK